MKSVITRDPDIFDGTPVFAGTRIPVQTLIDALRKGDCLDDFLLGFPSVSREQAIAFLEITLNNGERIDSFKGVIASETSTWLSADISGELPPYDWGEEGIPKGNPIEYDPDIGFVVVEEA